MDDKQVVSVVITSTLFLKSVDIVANPGPTNSHNFIFHITALEHRANYRQGNILRANAGRGFPVKYTATISG